MKRTMYLIRQFHMFVTQHEMYFTEKCENVKSYLQIKRRQN